MKSIDEIQDEIIEEFSLLQGDLDMCVQYLIELGRKIAPLSEAHRIEENIVKGCQSKVWLHAELDSDKVLFTADSDAIITKGIIALLIRVLSGQTPADIANANLYFIDKIGLKEHLSPTRSNGLLTMVKQMKMYGVAMA